MSLLFMMPEWTVPSEVWMQRMLELLQDSLGTIVARDTKGVVKWRDRVRAVALRQSKSIRFLWRFGIGRKSSHQILMREIRRPGITHVLCHYGDFALNYMKIWQAVNVHLFVHFHGYDATFDLRSYEQPDRLSHSETYQQDILKLSERAILIANSEFTKSLLMDAGIPADRIKVKYFGVPLPTETKSHTKREGINILHLGRLVDFKSPDRTINAFEIARSRGMKGNLTIAGDGPLRTTCELLRLRSPYRDTIQLIGTVTPERAQELFAEADIYTQHNMTGEISRQRECFGVSVVEAMAAALPIVGTKSGGVLETVIHKKTGLLGGPGDIETQADAFLQLAKDHNLRQRLGDAGRKRVEDHFSMENESASLRKILAY
jgi:glycosyltransferase involved in cell wall biosynthesis